MIRLLFILFFLLAWNETTMTSAINMNNNDDYKLIWADLSNAENNKTPHIHNNPGNLKCYKTGEFRVFNTLEEGYAALLHDLNLKITGKSAWTDSTTTIYDFIAIYAPAFENDVNTYVEKFCSETGLQPTDLLRVQRTEVIARGIVKVENANLYRQLYASK